MRKSPNPTGMTNNRLTVNDMRYLRPWEKYLREATHGWVETLPTKAVTSIVAAYEQMTGVALQATASLCHACLLRMTAKVAEGYFASVSAHEDAAKAAKEEKEA